ncbi:MAG: endolytic transglycosylase MltG [Helicobacteraceae bacterium]|jgi:UPF0755 protein|nr:endolytic transglycosylase MltG [Helicobacteraceae bacterium]
MWRRINIRKITSAVTALARIILFITLLLSVYLSQRLVHDRFVKVPSGSLRTIVTQLKADGIDLNELDRYLIYLCGVAKSGLNDFDEANSTRLDFYFALIRGRAAFDEITLLPGETTVIAVAQIASQLGLDKEKLLLEYYSLAPFPEGVLIPDTYQIVKNSDEKTVMTLLVVRSMKTHKDRAVKAFGRYDATEWFNIITKASIVQKEAANNEEMPLVASVIENRLNKKMRLQMDGTLNYGEFSHQRVTPERIRSDGSPFNTYKQRGIPPYPVSLASVEAVRAVLNPPQTDYLYFVRGRDGTHEFSATYRSHLNNIAEGKKP